MNIHHWNIPSHSYKTSDSLPEEPYFGQIIIMIMVQLLNIYDKFQTQKYSNAILY